MLKFNIRANKVFLLNKRKIEIQKLKVFLEKC